eukprot:gene12047-14094_t
MGSSKDNHLRTVMNKLKDIHRLFFQEIDSGKKPHVINIIDRVKKDILKGVKVVFSGVYPLNLPVSRQPLRTLAEELGAVVQNDIDKETTHLIAARNGTSKVNKAKANKIKVVHSKWLETSAQIWAMAKESDFPVIDETPPAPLVIPTKGAEMLENIVHTNPDAIQKTLDDADKELDDFLDGESDSSSENGSTHSDRSDESDEDNQSLSGDNDSVVDEESDGSRKSSSLKDKKRKRLDNDGETKEEEQEEDEEDEDDVDQDIDEESNLDDDLLAFGNLEVPSTFNRLLDGLIKQLSLSNILTLQLTFNHFVSSRLSSLPSLARLLPHLSKAHKLSLVFDNLHPFYHDDYTDDEHGTMSDKRGYCYIYEETFPRFSRNYIDYLLSLDNDIKVTSMEFKYSSIPLISCQDILNLSMFTQLTSLRIEVLISDPFDLSKLNELPNLCHFDLTDTYADNITKGYQFLLYNNTITDLKLTIGKCKRISHIVFNRQVVKSLDLIPEDDVYNFINLEPGQIDSLTSLKISHLPSLNIASTFLNLRSLNARLHSFGYGGQERLDVDYLKDPQCAIKEL